MTVITADFSEDENKKIGMVKAIYNLQSKAEAVKKIVQIFKIEN
jgi:hypothetical protein